MFTRVFFENNDNILDEMQLSVMEQRNEQKYVHN